MADGDVCEHTRVGAAWHRLHGSLGVVGLAVVVVLGACASDPTELAGDPPSASTAAAVEPQIEPQIAAPEPTSTVEPTAIPEPTPVPLSDSELTDLALAIYNESDQAAGWHTWDLVEARIQSSTRIELDLCTWDGETVKNQVRTARVDIDPTNPQPSAGNVAAELIGFGECTSNSMIESALKFLEHYDEQLRLTNADPASFGPDPWRELTTEILYPLAEKAFNDLADDGLHLVDGRPAGIAYPEDLQESVLYRTYTLDDEVPVLEILTCAPMNPDFGFYRGEVLIDDRRDLDEPSDQHVRLSQLVPAPDTERGWRHRDAAGRVWGDCDKSMSWEDGANAWKPDPVSWSVWDDPNA